MKKSYIGAVLLASGVAAWLAGFHVVSEWLVGAAVGWSMRGIAG